jgi:hypothetical protein
VVVLVRLPDETLVDAAMEAFHSHGWEGQKPVIYEVHWPELLAVLGPVFEDEFARKRSRVPARKPAKVDKGSQARGRSLVYARSDGRCEAAIAGWCSLVATDWHHRKARSLGGRWDASNGMHLCRACHAWITENPLGAAQRGWYLTHREDPSAVPVKRFGELVLLDDDGGFEPVEKGGTAA